MRPVRWAPLARRDFDRIDLHYRSIDADLSLDFGRKLISATALLNEVPFAGPVAIHGDRRKWSVRGTPYIVYYRVTETHIRILRILHSAQDQKTA